MTSYFNACGVTVANSNQKMFYSVFDVQFCAPHFEKGSVTHVCEHMMRYLHQDLPGQGHCFTMTKII